MLICQLYVFSCYIKSTSISVNRKKSADTFNKQKKKPAVKRTIEGERGREVGESKWIDRDSWITHCVFIMIKLKEIAWSHEQNLNGKIEYYLKWEKKILQNIYAFFIKAIDESVPSKSHVILVCKSNYIAFLKMV